jgi:hypothetical protein
MSLNDATTCDVIQPRDRRAFDLVELRVRQNVAAKVARRSQPVAPAPLRDHPLANASGRRLN